MSVLRFAELTPVPWKNGLGVTREIAVAPAGASMESFLWRVSIADVDTASPFSVFPGVDRTIVLLDGDGFTMTLDGQQRHALTQPCVPFAFAGEAKVDVALAGGATRDFNLMVRRGQHHGSVAALGLTTPAMLPDHGIMAHVARGIAHIGGHVLYPGDTWLGRGTVTPQPQCLLLVVTLAPP